MSPRLSAADSAKVLGVLAVACLAGLLYLKLVPPWQHFDEPTHFEYAWLIANRGRLPTPGDVDSTMRREVAASMLQHNFFSTETRPDLLAEGDEIWIGYSELRHPPGYYVLVSLPLRFARHLDITTQLYVARGTSFVLFLLTIAVTCAVMRNLTSPGSPLRWGVPLVLALLPPFTDVMTAVNNDVGAVFATSLFFLAAVRIVRLGVTWSRTCLLLVATFLGVITKNTSAIVAVLCPLVVLLAVAVHNSRVRLRLAAVCTVLLVALVLANFGWGDAAYWYRWQAPSTSLPSRANRTSVPVGSYALVQTASAEPQAQHLLSPLLPSDIATIKGRTITVGGWMWASRPVHAEGFGLLIGEQGMADLDTVVRPLSLSTTPSFVSWSYAVPAQTELLHFVISSSVTNLEGLEPTEIAFDGAVLVAGEFPRDLPPVFEGSSGRSLRWDGQPVKNLVRNPSAEDAWPRVRSWVQRVVARYAGRSPMLVLTSVLDFQRTGPMWLRTVLNQVLPGFYTGLGWGQISVASLFWLFTFRVVTAGAIIGAFSELLSRREACPPTVLPALVFLGLAAMLIWLNASMRPFPFLQPLEAVASARYGFPAAIPTALALVGGWRALWPRRFQQWGLGLLLFGLVILDLVSLAAIYRAF